MRTSAHLHFEHVFHEAPEHADGVFLLQARWPDGTTRIVGANSVTVRRFQLGPHRSARVAVSGDLAVDTAHRSLLPALRLTRSVRELVSTSYDFGYGFPNSKADAVMVRAGFKLLGKATRYARVLRHARYLPQVVERLSREHARAAPWMQRALQSATARRAAGAVVDLGRLAELAPHVARARARGALAWGEGFDARFDALWARARGEYDVIGERTAAFLRWRYPRCEVAMLVGGGRAGRGGEAELRAYAIVEREAGTGAAHLRDLFGHRGELGALLDLLLPALYRRGAASVSVQLLGAPDVVAHLEERGFEARGAGRTIVVQVGAVLAEERARIEDAARWHLFEVDEDT